VSKISIVTDSTAYIPQNLVDQYQISVIPLSLHWDEVVYLDGIDIQPDEFYRRLAKSKTMPTTSQATVAAFKQVFDRLAGEGREILTVTLSSKLSGTMDSAVQARAEMPPEARIELVDSLSISAGQEMMVLAAARLAEQGASLAECKAIVEKARENSGLVLVVDTLEFLHRGGRIGGGARFLGTALKLKPVLELVDGKLEALERVRTKGKALDRMVELVSARIQGRSPVRLGVIHANAEDEAKSVLQEVSKSLKPVETHVVPVSPVVGTHTGPGVVGLAYIAGV
jgi:DegV family protein with EDD domain